MPTNRLFTRSRDWRTLPRPKHSPSKKRIERSLSKTTTENNTILTWSTVLPLISSVSLQWEGNASRHPELPTLEMTNGAFLPMELVDTEPARMKKITDEQRAAICRQSTIKPIEYRRAIEQIRHHPKQQRFEDDPFVRSWQLNVDVKMITVPARVLPAPDVIYTNEYRVRGAQGPIRGVWELTGGHFYEPRGFPSVWAMINLSNLKQVQCEEFYTELSGVARHRGMDCPPPAVYEQMDPRYQSMEQITSSLRRMRGRNTDCQFFLVILPKESDVKNQAYITLKKLVTGLIVISDAACVSFVVWIRSGSRNSNTNASRA